MPRKNARPAAKKAAARLRARMKSNTKPEPPRVGFIAHHPHRASSVALAMMVAAMIEAPEPLEHHRHQKET